MDQNERELFERSIRAALESDPGAALEGALYGLGWHEALRGDARSAVSTLFHLCGELNVGSSLDGVLASVLCPQEPMAAVVLPMFASLEVPAERRDDEIVVQGIGSAGLRCSETAVVAARRGSIIEIQTVLTAQLDVRPVLGMDPALGWLEVRGTVPVRSGSDGGAERWRESVALGQLAISHQLIGASRSMLQLARNHATERVQFGVPISSFQAVRHRLADSLVAIEAAEASVAAGWEFGSTFAASVAKAVAGKSTRVVARNAQQVLAGIGFTAEHPLQRFVKRTLTLDQILGACDSITRSIGEELLRSRTLPAALPL